MVGFGFKQTWLAIRTHDPVATVAALGLRDLGTVPWRDGIDLAYFTDDRLAVTPPLPGADGASWVLVVGKGLLRPDAPTEVAVISAALDTEVQFFATHRVMELHRWERARDGTRLRGFEYVGETGEVNLWDGDPDPTEREVGLPAVVHEEVDVLVDEDDVRRVAGAWSVDPASLDGAPAPGALRLAAQH